MDYELDKIALDALEEFADGEITLTELKSIIGPDAIEAIRQLHDETNPDWLFDDPESF